MLLTIPLDPIEQSNIPCRHAGDIFLVKEFKFWFDGGETVAFL